MLFYPDGRVLRTFMLVGGYIVLPVNRRSRTVKSVDCTEVISGSLPQVASYPAKQLHDDELGQCRSTP